MEDWELLASTSVLAEVTSRLDNSTLQALSATPLWDTVASSISSPLFWYQRTEHLVQQHLKPRLNRDWKKAYYLLASMQDLNNPTAAEVARLDRLAVEILLELKYDPASSDSWILQIACESGNAEVVQLLLQDKRADPSIENNNCILIASEKGHLAVVSLLLQDKRVDPSDDNSSALTHASDAAIVELLLKDGRANPNAALIGPYNMLERASHPVFADVDIVRLLLEDGRIDPTSNNNRALIIALQSGHPEIIELLEVAIRSRTSL